MASFGRIFLTLMFLFWSLLLLGSSGIVGLLGDGLALLLSGIGLSWLAGAAAGLGKAILLVIWIVSACVYGVFFALLGARLVPPGQAAEPGQVTLHRDADGVYR